MALMTSLFVLLVSAHVLGWVAARLHLPALAGHMLAGVILGPSLFEWIVPNPGLSAASDIAVFFVVLTAGLEMRLLHVLEVFRGRGTAALAVGFLVPLIAAGALAHVFSLPTVPAIVVALCISVTALPIALQILRDFQLLGTQIARVSISGSLFTDIIVLASLGVLIDWSVGGSDRALNAAGLAILKLGLLIGGIVVAQLTCLHLMKRKAAPAAPSLARSSAKLAFVLIFVLGLGALSEALGFHFAIGAFFAAMMISGELIGEDEFARLEGTCELLTMSLFGPLFLAYQGMQFELDSLTQPGFVVLLLIVAIASKLAGGYAVGRLQSMNAHDAMSVGIVMNARGVMQLLVASIALNAGLVDRDVFSALVLVGLVTTVLTPVMLKAWRSRVPVALGAGETPRAP